MSGRDFVIALLVSSLIVAGGEIAELHGKLADARDLAGRAADQVKQAEHVIESVLAACRPKHKDEESF